MRWQSKHVKYTNNIRLNNTHILMLVFNLTLISNNAMMNCYISNNQNGKAIILSIQKQQTSNSDTNHVFEICNTNCDK